MCWKNSKTNLQFSPSFYTYLPESQLKICVLKEYQNLFRTYLLKNLILFVIKIFKLKELNLQKIKNLNVFSKL